MNFDNLKRLILCKQADYFKNYTKIIDKNKRVFKELRKSICLSKNFW